MPIPSIADAERSATLTLRDWSALRLRVKNLPVEYRQELLRVVLRDVADLNSDLSELMPRHSGGSRR